MIDGPDTEWRPLGAMPSRQLVEARLAAHWAMQVIPAIADATLEHAPDDSHSNAEWLAGRDALVGHRIAGEVRVGLHIADLALLVLDGGDRPLARLPLDGQTLEQALAWVAGEVAGRTGGAPSDRPALRDYDMPGHPAGRGESFAVAGLEAGLAELARWYHDADLALRAVRADHDHASPVACWPHHFDIATLIALDPDHPDPEAARSIGVGLSPGDEGYAEPYWYVTHWPRTDQSARPDLELGSWTGFGAVLPGSRFLGPGGAPGQEDDVTRFIRSSVATSRALLGE